MSEDQTGQVAPVVDNEAQPAATPEIVATQPEGTETPEGETTQADDKKFTQAELNEIIQKEKAKAEAKAERRALKAYADKLEKLHPTQQPPQVQSDNGRPTQAQFANVDDYVEAMADWKLAQRDQISLHERQQEQAKSLNEKTEGFYAEAQKTPGFDRDVFEELPLTQAIAAAVIESDEPAKLMVWMAANPDEVERIAKLSPARQAAEVGKLEAQLVTAPKVSKAPAPITPIGGSKGGSKHPADMTDEEYAKWRKTAHN